MISDILPFLLHSFKKLRLVMKKKGVSSILVKDNGRMTSLKKNKKLANPKILVSNEFIARGSKQ